MADASRYTRIAPFVEKRVQTFAGDSAASQPRLLEIDLPVTPVLDLSQFQKTSMVIGKASVSGARTTLVQEQLVTPEILEILNGARAITVERISYFFDINANANVDVWFNFLYNVNGNTRALPVYSKALLPAFATSFYASAAIERPQIIQPTWFDVSDSQERPARLGNIIGVWSRHAGGGTFFVQETAMTLGLYY